MSGAGATQATRERRATRALVAAADGRMASLLRATVLPAASDAADATERALSARLAGLRGRVAARDAGESRAAMAREHAAYEARAGLASLHATVADTMRATPRAMRAAS